MLHFQKWKLILVFGVVLAGFMFALPNLFPASTLAKLPDWVPHKQVNLGLDLQGGAHLLYQIDEKEMVEDWLNTIRGDVRETLRSNRIGYTDLAQNVANAQRVGADPQARGYGQGSPSWRSSPSRSAATCSAASPGNDLDVKRQAATSITLSRHRGRPERPHRLGHSGLDRDHQAPRRRLRHHRAEHSARGPQPHARPGARHLRRRAPQEA